MQTSGPPTRGRVPASPDADALSSQTTGHAQLTSSGTGANSIAWMAGRIQVGLDGGLRAFQMCQAGLDAQAQGLEMFQVGVKAQLKDSMIFQFGLD